MDNGPGFRMDLPQTEYRAPAEIISWSSDSLAGTATFKPKARKLAHYSPSLCQYHLAGRATPQDHVGRD